jgi:hypothetical protein
MTDFRINPELANLTKRHLEWAKTELRPYYFGCRLRILIVADSFIYFNDDDFGLSEVVATLRGMSSFAYPVTVDLAHRSNPGVARLAGGTPNFTFSDASLANYHQIWIIAAARNSSPIDDGQRKAIRKFMDNGGGVFATGDHEDLGAAMGGYIPRVRSMRRWFFPGPGPDGEPVAPHGSNATRHDTNREGHDAGWSFNDQSDDVPQEIIPHFFGGGLITSVHPVLCTKNGPIRVLPDHPHEGRCEVPGNLGGNYTIGTDSFREYPDGPDGQPLAPQVIATATMIAGAAAPEFGKPPIPGGTFGVIGAWDGHRAGDFGRVVVDATWHHFINVNLIGDRDLGPPSLAVPKSMGFLHTPAGVAHYEQIKAYFRNIAEWLTPKSRRRCLIRRHIWAATHKGWFLEEFRRDDLVFTGNLVFGKHWALRPCDRLNLIFELPELQRWPWLDLFDPQIRFPEIEKLREAGRLKAIEPALKMVPAAMLGAVAIEMAQLDLPVEKLEKELGDDESRVPELEAATKRGAERGAEFVEKMLGEFGDAAKILDKIGRR